MEGNTVLDVPDGKGHDTEAKTRVEESIPTGTIQEYATLTIKQDPPISLDVARMAVTETTAAASETVFSPIKVADIHFDSDEQIFKSEDGDSCNRRMSREDIETMEIMSKENENTQRLAPVPSEDEDTRGSLPTNAHIPELVKNEKRSSTSTPSSLVPRVTDPILKQNNIFSSILACDLVEYRWPPDDNGDYYMLQEQVSTFLCITSFKRKYPEIERRKLDPQEVKYLIANMLINEVQVTLGLTAVRSRDVCDLMIKEYPQKYHEYTQVLDEKQKQNIKNKHMQYSAPAVEKSQMPHYLKRAMKQVSAYNARLNRQRRDEFAVYYDMQTNVLHYPKNKVKKKDPELTNPGLYPCALIPGQFQDYYQKYSSGELNYLPLNSVIYGPPPPLPADLNLSEESSSDIETETESTSMLSADNKSVKSESAENHPLIEAPTIPTPSPPEHAEVKLDDKEEVSSDADKTTVKSKIAENGDDVTEDYKKDFDESLMDIDEDHEKPICGICLKDETANKKDEPEDLISCSQCDNHGHPSCLDMSKDLVSVIVTYNWQCLECKTCTYCSKPHHEDKMMFCDRCDRGYHTFCVGLRSLPSGLWMCPTCTRSDPDFAKRGGRRRGSSGTPRKRRSTPSGGADQSVSESPPKQRRRRRTKKEMEEAREKERLEKEERLKKRLEKKEKKSRRRKERRENAEKGDENVELNDSSILEEGGKEGDGEKCDEVLREIPVEDSETKNEDEAESVEDGKGVDTEERTSSDASNPTSGE